MLWVLVSLKMYGLNDTIAAVSSPGTERGVIVRLSGPRTIELLKQIFEPCRLIEEKSLLLHGQIAIDNELTVEAQVYLFIAPNSYTGDTLAEIHFYTNQSVTQALMERLFAAGARMAEPGEFTARGYLNGKMDLAQAEAVNEVIVSSNRFQLSAGQKLLAGRLGQIAEAIRVDIFDCLSLLEAGLDFSGEDIEFITQAEAVERLEAIKGRLQQLLSGSISYEVTIDLPAVGIAGAPNAGKSSLLNKLLGKERSIVSGIRKTTRDVLSGQLELERSKCVLFDCAGLIAEPVDILDRLAQEAAAEALSNSSLIIFCVDISKDNWSEDLAIRELIVPAVSIAAAAKADLVEEDALDNRLTELGRLFGLDFLPISIKTGQGIGLLQKTIDEKLIELFTGSRDLTVPTDSRHQIALTARHVQAVTDAIDCLSQATEELKADNDEIAAMMLRTAYRQLANIEQEHIDEKLLKNIFSRFCIGK